jgi:hypothetical protein
MSVSRRAVAISQGIREIIMWMDIHNTIRGASNLIKNCDTIKSTLWSLNSMIYLSALLAGEYMDDSILAAILYIKYKQNAV